MNRGRINPQPERGPSTFGMTTTAQQLTGVADQTTPGAWWFVLCLPKTPIGEQVAPWPPSNPYYPLILGY